MAFRSLGKDHVPVFTSVDVHVSGAVHTTVALGLLDSWERFLRTDFCIGNGVWRPPVGLGPRHRPSELRHAGADATALPTPPPQEERRAHIHAQSGCCAGVPHGALEHKHHPDHSAGSAARFAVD